MDYSVVRYTKCGLGNFVATMSGMGRNKGTWDHSHSKRTAQRHAKRLEKEDTTHLYRVEPSY